MGAFFITKYLESLSLSKIFCGKSAPSFGINLASGAFKKRVKFVAALTFTKPPKIF